MLEETIKSGRILCAALTTTMALTGTQVNAEGDNQQTCDLELQEVLDRYVTVRGGKEALGNLQALRIKSRQHEGKWNPSFDYRIRKPNLMVIAASYADGEVILEGYDGERAWEKLDPAKPAVYVGGDAEKGMRQGGQSPVFLFGLHQLAGLGHNVTLKGCEAIHLDHYYVVNVKATFGTDINYYVNSSSFLLERARSTRPLHPTLDPTRITIEERWADFRFVDGVLYPFNYFQWNVDEGKLLTFLIVDSIENDKEEPGLYENPDKGD